MMKSMLFGPSIRGKLVTCQYTLSETWSSIAFAVADSFDLELTCEVFLDSFCLFAATEFYANGPYHCYTTLMMLTSRADHQLSICHRGQFQNIFYYFTQAFMMKNIPHSQFSLESHLEPFSRQMRVISSLDVWQSCQLMLHVYIYTIFFVLKLTRLPSRHLFPSIYWPRRVSPH